VHSVARADPATCALEERVGDVAARVAGDELGTCVVVNDARVVLGVLGREELPGDPARTAEAAMRPGPSTFRANVSVLEMAEHLVRHDVERAIVTTPDGVLLGVLTRDAAIEAARTVHEGHEHHDEH
jgi:Mg/Co/Ni transporter MgtE